MKTLLLAATLILSGAVQGQVRQDSIRLYLKCANWISVGGFIPKYSPATSTLAIRGGRILENHGNDKIVVMPDSSVVLLTIREKGMKEKTLTMYGVATPRTLIVAKINNKETWRESKGPFPESLELIAEADQSFAAELPKDSNYRVTEWELVLSRGNKEISRSKFKESRVPRTELTKLKPMIRRGDSLQINILTVKRRNAAGELVLASPVESQIVYTIE